MDTNRLFEISIKAVVLNDAGKILICKTETGDWDLPGGRITHGEKIEECLQREIKEELGVSCKLLDQTPLFFWYGTTDSGRPKFVVGFRTNIDSVLFKLSNENLESRFFGKSDLDSVKLHNGIINLKMWLNNARNN